MPNKSVNKEKHKNVSAEYMCTYRRSKTLEKAQENKIPQTSTSTDTTPLPIIYDYNRANKYFQNNIIGNPFGYTCDICDRL
jgi:hypothetical protein